MKFENKIKELCTTVTGPYRRPFAPNRNWSTAQVIIVGTNPATPLRTEFSTFEDYWRALTTNPDAFYHHYASRHLGGMSKTSKWTNEFIANLQPLNCLVTNVCWYPVHKQKEIPKSEWKFGQNALNVLVSNIKPRVLFCHGAMAESFAKSLGATVDRYGSPDSQTSIVDGMLILAYHHLSGQGLRKGARFDPASELPRFAERIKRHVGIS